MNAVHWPLAVKFSVIWFLAESKLSHWWSYHIFYIQSPWYLLTFYMTINYIRVCFQHTNTQLCHVYIIRYLQFHTMKTSFKKTVSWRVNSGLFVYFELFFVRPFIFYTLLYCMTGLGHNTKTIMVLSVSLHMPFLKHLTSCIYFVNLLCF